MTTNDDTKTVSSKAGEALAAGLDRAVQISRPTILKHIEQTRRNRRDASPEEIIRLLGRRFTAAVAGSGAAAGASAAAPGVSTPISLALAAGDVAGYTGLSAMYVLALAEIHGVPIDDLERRRTLVMGVLLGQAGADAVKKTAGRTGAHWAGKMVSAVPTETLKQVNRVLGHNFVTKYGSRQGVLVLGKQAPFGVGAAIGGAGNATFARFTIRSAKRAFGPAPTSWPAHLATSVEADEQQPGTTPG